jgi:2,5-furandicarboxylate decarboxylase 1
MIVGGRHPEHLVTGAVAREATLLQSVRAVVPGVRQVVLTEGGNCRFHAVISLAPRVPGEAKLAITAAFASQDLIKNVVVVDEDIDPADPGEVEWALSTRMRAPEDIVMISGMKSNPVDPTSVGRTITKVGFDATLAVDDPRRAEPRVGVPPEVMARVRSRWKEIAGDSQTAGEGPRA